MFRLAACATVVACLLACSNAPQPDVGAFAAVGDADDHPGHPDPGAQVESEKQLSIRFDFDTQRDSPAIDMDKPFRVVLTNASDESCRIWNPKTRNGYYQWSFHFENPQNGKKHVTRRRQIEDDGFWKALQDGIVPGSEIIEIAPKDSYTTRVRLSDFKWGDREWTGLPDPNSGIVYSVSAQFESAVASQRANEPIWIGKIQSDAISAKLVATKLKLPHDYLENDFPDKSLEVMKADPTLIARKDEYSRTPLHVAARYGHTKVVQWLLEKGADVNAVAYNGFTPLHLTDHPEAIALILKQKPDLRIRCRCHGQTALQKVVGKLVEASDADERLNWRRITDLYLDAGADYDIFVAIHLNDLNRLKTILKESPELADDFQGQSPLRTAASLGRLEICRYLVEEHQVDVNDFERGVGYPVVKAALAYPRIVRLLIDNGADLKTRITWRGSGRSTIGDNGTALHFAAANGTPETINLLIDSGVDIFATAHDSTDESDKQTALEVAARFGKADNAIAILNHAKFDQADAQLRKGLLDKSLLIATRASWDPEDADRPKLVEALLRKGADPNAKENDASAMEIAASAMHPDDEDGNREIRKVVAILVKYGASSDLFSAVAIGDEASVARLLEQDPDSTNARSPNGYPALHFGVRMNYENIVEKLISAGGNVEIGNNSEYTGDVDETALHCAAFWDRYEIAKRLIDAGANVNALTKRKSTPLHSAARMTNVSLARLLLESGAKIDARDEDGQTPLDWCSELKWTNADEIEKLLREYRAKNDE